MLGLYKIGMSVPTISNFDLGLGPQIPQSQITSWMSLFDIMGFWWNLDCLRRLLYQLDKQHAGCLGLCYNNQITFCLYCFLLSHRSKEATFKWCGLMRKYSVFHIIIVGLLKTTNGWIVFKKFKRYIEKNKNIRNKNINISKPLQIGQYIHD